MSAFDRQKSTASERAIFLAGAASAIMGICLMVAGVVFAVLLVAVCRFLIQKTLGY